MSTTAGYFDETRLLAIRVLAEQMAQDGRIKLQYTPRVDILKAILEKQTARITPLESRTKDNTVEIEWLNACEIETGAFDNCVTCGNELSSNIEERTLTKQLVTNFKVNENTFLNNDFGFNDAVAKGLLRAEKTILDAFAQYAVAVLNANIGTNAFTGGRGNVVGNVTYVNPAYWNYETLGYFVRVANQNQFAMPYLVDGGNLIEQATAAKMRMAGADNQDQNNFFNLMPYYHDEWNINQVNSGTFGVRTYMIEQGALAMANKVYYGDFSMDNPRIEGTQKRFSMPSKFFPGLNLDVYVETTCNESGKYFSHCFQVVLTADIYVNPVGCDSGNTGILTFECGTGS